MPTMKLMIEYDGSGYAGWQRQSGQPTVQAVLEDAIQKISRVRTPVVGAGRTDAGVHALGQVASFRSDRPLSAEEWKRALNGVLPQDVSVLSAEQVPDEFHARYAARTKVYEYRILTRPERSPLERARVWHIHTPLQVPAMREAAVALLGRHDFSSFQGSPTETDNPICHVSRLDVEPSGELVRIVVEADRFLKQMVRAIVGTLVEVGSGKRTPDGLEEVLRARDRRAAGYTAPAHGLFLVKVHYR